MNQFILSPKKSRRNKPTIKVGQVIETVHGKITILEYVNRSRVQIKFADQSVRPNPQWVAVRWIRKNEIELEGKP